MYFLFDMPVINHVFSNFLFSFSYPAHNSCKTKPSDPCSSVFLLVMAPGLMRPLQIQLSFAATLYCMMSNMEANYALKYDNINRLILLIVFRR